MDLLYHDTHIRRTTCAMPESVDTPLPRRLAMMAKECGARRLLTGHYSSRYKDDTVILDEASAIFPDTVLGHEGLVVPV